jgi:predicted nuclease of predicted toxin-antitoxin system
VSRILLDHCVPKPLRRWLSDHEVRTCHEEGWDAFLNGELIAAAEAAGFDVFITADKNLRYQQNIALRRLAIIELPTNRLSLLPFLVPALQQALTGATPGSYHEISLP